MVLCSIAIQRGDGLQVRSRLFSLKMHTHAHTHALSTCLNCFLWTTSKVYKDRVLQRNVLTLAGWPQKTKEDAKMPADTFFASAGYPRSGWSLLTFSSRIFMPVFLFDMLFAHLFFCIFIKFNGSSILAHLSSSFILSIPPHLPLPVGVFSFDPFFQPGHMLLSCLSVLDDSVLFL